MAFPTTSVLDDFNRANADPISGTWTTPIAFAGLSGAIELSSNAIGLRAGCALWNAATYGPTVEAYITLTNLPVNGAGATYVFARMSALSATANGYSVDFRITGGIHSQRIMRWDAGAETGFASATQTFTAGDKLGIGILGSTVSLYRYTGGSWSLVVSGTDSTYSAAGYIGFGKTDANNVLDEFGGGTTSGQTLLPDADLAAGGWGTSPLYSKWNDSSDATIGTATAS